MVVIRWKGLRGVDVSDTLDATVSKSNTQDVFVDSGNKHSANNCIPDRPLSPNAP